MNKKSSWVRFMYRKLREISLKLVYQTFVSCSQLEKQHYTNFWHTCVHCQFLHISVQVCLTDVWFTAAKKQPLLSTATLQSKMFTVLGQIYLTIGSSFQESRASKFIRSPPYQGEVDRLAIHANVLKMLRYTCCHVILEQTSIYECTGNNKSIHSHTIVEWTVL